MRVALVLVITGMVLASLQGIAQVSCNLNLTATPVGASCSSACDGSVILTPSGGTAPYSLNAFDHNFPGSSVNLSLFEVRNGNFTVSGNQLIASANTGLASNFDNTITTLQTFPDNGKIVVEGSFYIDYNTYGTFGLAEDATITSETQLPYSFFFSYGTLYASVEGNLIEITNYSSSTWYDLKVEKLGATVNFYMRNTGMANYQLVASEAATFTNPAYKLAAAYYNFYNYYGGFKTTNWRVGGNPPTTGLCPGNYSYTIFDANGCFAVASVTLGINTGPGALQLGGSAQAASCVAASDGTVNLVPTGGTAPYSYGFSHTFQGTEINETFFELRNGNFSQGSDLRQGNNYSNNNSWDNSISTRRSFSDGGYLLFEASFKFDANADVIFGFTNTGVINEFNDLKIGFRLTNGSQLYAYTDAGVLQLLGSVNSDTWYDFKIEKTGNSVKYYMRLYNTGEYILQHTAPYYTNNVEYKAATLNFANYYSSAGGYNTKGWNLQSVPKTANLAPGVYTYTISDANGCTATAVLTVTSGNANSIMLTAAVAAPACNGNPSGSVTLTPSGGTLPYSYSFNHAFSSTMVEAGLFEVRNGNFSQVGGDLRGNVITNSTFWDNSVATYYTFNDAGHLTFEGSFSFDATAQVNFGFVNNVATINDPSQVQMGFAVNGSQLYARMSGSTMLIETVAANTWYDFKIEKRGHLVKLYRRLTGSGNPYTQLYAIPSTGSGTSFRAAVLMYGSTGGNGGFNSKNWMIEDNPATTGLVSGLHTFKVYDAKGCYAAASVNLPSVGGFSVTALPVPTTTWNDCNGAVSFTTNNGALTYKAKDFSDTFGGISLNTGLFTTRNGAFSVNGTLVQANLQNNSGWDNSISSINSFNEDGYLAVEMDLKFSSASQIYFGLADATQPLNETADLRYAFRYESGSLYAYSADGGSVLIGNIPAGLWTGFKIEKTGSVVNYYLRPQLDNEFQLVYTINTSTAVSAYKPGILNYFDTQANRGYSSDNWIVYTQAELSGLCTGNYIYTVTGSTGCSRDVPFTISTNLALVQTMTAPPDVQVSTDPGQAYAATVNLGTPAFSATPVNITVTNNAPAQFPVGQTIVTWTATDGTTTVTGTQKVTVTDTEAPSIFAPANLNLPLFVGQTTITGVALGSPVVTDNVPGVTYTNNAPAQYGLGITVIIWTATDAAGNTSTATQQVEVVYTPLPSITAPADVTVPTDAGQAYATGVVLGTATLGSNVPGVTVSNNAPTQFPVGVTNVNWTVSDNYGNSASAIQKVTVIDTENPAITTPANVTVFANVGQAYATGVNLGAASATDNVGATITNNAPTQFIIGTTTVTWTATDAAGNSATATQIVTVIDNQAPQISAPATVTVNTNAGQAYATGVSLGSPSVTDNAPGSTYTNNAPLQFPWGTTSITWTATDASGNTATATQLVIVVDTEVPVITAPANVSVSIAPPATSASGVVLGTPVYGDNVPGATVSNNAPSVFPLGTTVVTWTATDASGNFATATQLVTVAIIEEPPVANCKPATVTLVNGSATVNVSQVNNGSTAAAGIASITLSKTQFGCADIGANTVILTVTDLNGRSSSCTTTVTVIGSIPTTSVLSTPNSNVYTGGISTNLYIGYGAQSTTLKANVPALNGPYTYSWTGTGIGNPTTQSVVFAPADAGSYTFTVMATNAYGCKAGGAITICVKDIRVTDKKGNKDNKKVYICHIPPGNPANAHTLEVSTNAVAAHLKHGDKLGTCNQVCGAAARPAITSVEAELFEVQLAPNPSTDYFVLRLKSSDQQTPVSVRVVDALGRTISNEKIGAATIYKFGETLANGSYFVEVTQGSERKLVRLVKQ